MSAVTERTTDVPAALAESAPRQLVGASARVVLASSDPVFLALCKGALEAGTNTEVVAAVSLTELRTALQRVVHDRIVIDVDGEDLAAVETLATKVTLLSEAPIVLVSAYLAPGSRGLSALLQSIAASFVQKPQGPSSLSLASEDGPPFAAAVLSPLAEQEDDPRPDELDAGWDIEEELDTEQGGGARG